MGVVKAVSYTHLDVYKRQSNGYTSDYYRLVTGLVTSVKTKVLDTDKWLTVTTYYDDHCRVIQSVSDNLQGQKSRVDFDYDFVGNLVRKKESHGISASKIDILETENVYDDRGRLLSSKTSLNGGAPALVTYSYNDVGQLVSRKLGQVTETITYNPRGWITGKESAPFKMKLRYEVPLAGAGACWNGNICLLYTSGEWIRNPNFEAGVEAINANFRIMGQVANFTSITNASNGLIQTLNQLISTYENASSHNARMAASWFRTAKSYVIQSLNEVNNNAVSYTHLDVYKRQTYIHVLADV